MNDVFEFSNQEGRQFKLNIDYAKLSLSSDGGIFIDNKKAYVPFDFTVVFHGMQFYRFNIEKDKTDILSTIVPGTGFYNKAVDIFTKKTYEELNSTVSQKEGKITWRMILGIVYEGDLYALELARSSVKAFIDVMQKQGLKSAIVIRPEPGFTNWTLSEFMPQKKGAIKYLAPVFKFNKIITKSDPNFNALYEQSNKFLQEVKKFNDLNSRPNSNNTDDDVIEIF